LTPTDAPVFVKPPVSSDRVPATAERGPAEACLPSRRVAEPEVIAETDRVLLRPWGVDEADRFFDIHRRMEVARWIGGQPMVDRAEAVRMIEQVSDRLAEDPRFGSWAVIERSSGVSAGSVLLKPLPDSAAEIEIGWHLHPDSWGRGLATEAAGALLARGFALGLPEIWAVTHLDNRRSARVCEKIGMRLLGVTHRWYREPSLMFWAGTDGHQRPTLEPDEPARTEPTHRSGQLLDA
jgi:RimJ/RimL family protein N-acetyltransferase